MAIGKSKLPKNNFAAIAQPAVTDDKSSGWTVGSQWFYSGKYYVCTNNNPGAAVWSLITPSVDVTELKGNWDAATNNPVLIDGIGDIGDMWRVSVAGTRNLGSGSITWKLGDYAVYNASNVWEIWRSGVANTDELTEGSTNLFYTALRAIGAALTGFATSGTRTAISASDTTLQAFNKVQKYLNDLSAIAFSGTASDVANTPAGNIIATTVQAAIDELDGQDTTIAGNLSSHTSNTSNPHSVTKSQVGLSNVDNTADTSKPVSTAQQTALDLKENAANKENTTLDTSTTKFPTNRLTKEYADSVSNNASVIGKVLTGFSVGSRVTIAATDTILQAFNKVQKYLNDLGTAAYLNVGTSANNIVQLDGSAKLPAIDGSQLTNLSGGSAASESAAGIIELATQSESDTGTDDARAITPLKLKTRQGFRFVGRLTASNSSQLSQVLSTGKKYEFHFSNIIPATNNSWLVAQLSSDGGSSWLNSSYFSRKLWATTSDAAGSSTNNTTRFTIAGTDADGNTGINSTSNRGGLSGIFQLFDPANSAIYTHARWDVEYALNSSFDYNSQVEGSGRHNSAVAINAIRFIMKAVNSDSNSGNITSGYIDVWEFNA